MVSPRRAIQIAGALVLVAVVVGVGIYLLPRGVEYSNRPQVFPDGTILTLVQVDYGRTNRLYEESPYPKMFRRLIPSGGINVLGHKIQRPKVVSMVTSPEDELVFWLKVTLPPAAVTNAVIQRYDVMHNCLAVAFDENGKECQNRPGSPRTVSSNLFIPFTIPAFPRDGKMVGLRISRRSEGNSGDWKILAEFKTANPDPGPHPRWTPHPLPDVQKVGSLEFALTKFEAVANPKVEPYVSLDDCRTVFHITVTEDGRPTAVWTPISAQLAEANGNFRVSSPVFAYHTGGASYFFGSLDPAVPWKMKVEFSHTNDFGPAELWTITNLAVGNGTITRTNVVQGTPVALKLLARRFLNIDLPGKPEGFHAFIISATDDSGQDLRERRMSSSALSQMATLNPLTNTTNISVTIAVTKTVLAEFLAQPVVARDFLSSHSSSLRTPNMPSPGGVPSLPPRAVLPLPTRPGEIRTPVPVPPGYTGSNAFPIPPSGVYQIPERSIRVPPISPDPPTAAPPPRQP